MKRKYMTENDCYQSGRKINPKGIMIHSTAVPGVMAAAWFSRWNKSYLKGEINRQVCVHAFVDDQEVWQYLPWDHRGWHAGGTANDTHIGIEICEPGGFSYGKGVTMVGYDAAKQEAYFRRAWKNTINLCVFLCEKYGWTEENIICHSEGAKRKIASNHADVMHWFPKHKESMDTFRKEVNKALSRALEREGKQKVGLFQEGDIVEIIDSAKLYYPGGPLIPEWVKKEYHKVLQVTSNGKTVTKGGAECVLLGKKVNIQNRKESDGIMTWVDTKCLRVIELSSQPTKDVRPPEEKQYFRVQVGAFTHREHAQSMVDKLKRAGFEGIIQVH
ncbi:N-acetylmuramoyl-L-alanine amidase [Evansella tamaricis]|uniref:N-acetylmuramoyl-L-alanine amidase n=1 Tax=Evansella tamaricis TaxID=2069301 RepID=A0ABS6JDZ6_9BACI|nr:N-acetylmuramoyl-L-alanine amidase [Evansella tamaricis]MBU9711902.1 N-acetylmuramoyl-L-alanine amidase [Evansella tamaricis]